jgi:drug/metabolite transporter (DMT)-like permease
VLAVTTGPGLPPRQQRKMFRTFRFAAISNAIFGVLLVAIGIFELVIGRRDAYVYATLIFGVAWLWLAAVSWKRAAVYREREQK